MTVVDIGDATVADGELSDGARADHEDRVGQGGVGSAAGKRQDDGADRRGEGGRITAAAGGDAGQDGEKESEKKRGSRGEERVTDPVLTVSE